jgi:hypothetical protein
VWLRILPVSIPWIYECNLYRLLRIPITVERVVGWHYDYSNVHIVTILVVTEFYRLHTVPTSGPQSLVTVCVRE